MTLYCDNASLTSGTTVDTFGTGVNIILNASAKKIEGMIVVAYDSVFTAAEGSMVRTRINSTGIPFLSSMDFLTGGLETSGPATNSSGQGSLQELIPLDYDCKGGETVTIDAAPTTTITTGRRVQVGVLYSDGNVDATVKDNFAGNFGSLPAPAKGG